MKATTLDEASRWYSESKHKYAGLADIVRSTMEGLLKGAKIDFLSVTSRAKSIESFREKAERKGYADPQKDMTDLAGIRVITFIEKDVGTVCEVISKTFHVHKDKSPNKSEELEVDRFGYRSVHLVCDLGEDRAKLPEFALYKHMLFEIQVRTVLQHAWAEIEHDRNYKFAGVLPTAIRRRMYSIAGMLEMADREFNTIASELDNHALEVAATAKKGDLDIELTSTSFVEFLKNKLVGQPIEIDSRPSLGSLAIKELNDFGVTSVTQLDKLMSKQFLDLVKKMKPNTTDIGLIRSAMMFEDVERYFRKAWKRHFSGFSGETFKFLCEKYDREKLLKILRERKIRLEHEN